MHDLRAGERGFASHSAGATSCKNLLSVAALNFLNLPRRRVHSPCARGDRYNAGKGLEGILVNRERLRRPLRRSAVLSPSSLIRIDGKVIQKLAHKIVG